MDAPVLKVLDLRIAAMGILNKYGTHRSVQDQMDEVQQKVDLDIVPKLLDALAGICVQESSDSFAAALELSASSVIIYVASNRTEGVPDGALARLQAAWDFMKSVQNDPNCAAAAGHVINYPDLKAMHLAFLGDQARYSWPAIAVRNCDEGRELIAALERFLAHDCALHKEDCYGGDCVGRLTESDVSLLRTVIDLVGTLHAKYADLQTVSKAVIIDQLILYGKIKALLKDGQSGQLGNLIEHVSRAPVRFYLRRLCWMGVAYNVLSKIAHNKHYYQWFTGDLVIKTVPPAPLRRITLDFQDQQFFGEAEFVCNTYPVQHRPPELEEEWRTWVLEPLRAHFGTTMNDEWVASADAYTHSECALLEFVVAHGGHSCQPYIGVSEPSCVPCWLTFTAYNLSFKHRPFYIRGCSGQSPVVWDPPQLDGAPEEMHSIFSTRMSLALMGVLVNWRLAMAKLRGA